MYPCCEREFNVLMPIHFMLVMYFVFINFKYYTVQLNTKWAKKCSTTISYTNNIGIHLLIRAHKSRYLFLHVDVQVHV